LQEASTVRQVNIQEAKTQLSKLIASGEEIVISRYGEPVARLIPIQHHPPQRVPGSARGKFEVPEDFFAPLPKEFLEAFEK
jgi:prevent-host-death family protein